MLHYPKIPSSADCPGGRCIAFEKVDGTNMHFDWDRDFGWHAFGTRRDMFNLTADGVRAFEDAHPGLEGCAQHFERALASPLAAIFRQRPELADVQEMKAFAEWVGPGSFAGRHVEAEAKELVLFDVEAVGRGILGPETFVELFGSLRIPRVVYRGKFTGKFADDVRAGRFDVAEGVVVKGGEGPDLWMAKIKTHAYMERLRATFGAKWDEYWE